MHFLWNKMSCETRTVDVSDTLYYVFVGLTVSVDNWDSA